jgi:hypothetical protein
VEQLAAAIEEATASSTPVAARSARLDMEPPPPVVNATGGSGQFIV